MSERDRVLRGWAALRENGPTGSPHLLEAADLKVETGFGTAKLGVDAENRAEFLLPVAHSARRPKEVDVALLRTLVQHLGQAGGYKPYLVVTCMDHGLEHAFADLIEAVLGRIDAGEGGMAAFVAAVKDLRALFETPAQVDETRIRGLVAELLMLERLASRDPRAVDLWFGPDKDRHDFRGGKTAIEVKSSPRVTSRITISAVEQLAEPAGGSLHLRRYILERSIDGAASVAGLFDAIQSKGVSVQTLRQKLNEMGCADPASPAWNRVTYNVEGCETYRVSDDFPRITPQSFTAGAIPAGVSDVVYNVDLAQAAHLKVGESDIEALETAILACLT